MGANVSEREKTNPEFIRRFTKLEKRLQAQGRRLGTATLNELEAIWKQVK